MIEGILTDISAERAAEAVADGLADVYRLQLRRLRRTAGPADEDRALPRVLEPQRRGRLAERDPAAISPPHASRSRGCSTGSRSHLDALGHQPALGQRARSRRRRASAGRRCRYGRARWASGTGLGRRSAPRGARCTPTGSPSSRSATPPTTTGTSSRDFDELETARAFRQALTDRGVEAVLTSDWPLDEYGRGDISLRVPRRPRDRGRGDARPESRATPEPALRRRRGRRELAAGRGDVAPAGQAHGRRHPAADQRRRGRPRSPRGPSPRTRRRSGCRGSG